LYRYGADFAPLLKYDISGVGLNIAEDAEDTTRLKVLGLVLDSSAARAGVKQGDELVAVDGVAVRGRSAFQAVSLIQAAPAPDVRVTVSTAVPTQQGGEAGEGANGGGSSDDSSSSSSRERVVTLRRSSSASNPVGRCKLNSVDTWLQSD
jgi:carboxyl-terminal processing protease